jgi:Holliday junction resolvase RusA-like endonuclease
MYTDAKTVAFEDRVAFYSLDAFGLTPPLEGPVSVEIVAFIKPPKKPGPRHGARAGVVVGTHRACIKKPDADNIAKAVLDGIGLAGHWRDDCQVVSLSVLKLWAAADEVPRTLVTVRPLVAVVE